MRREPVELADPGREPPEAEPGRCSEPEAEPRRPPLLDADPGRRLPEADPGRCPKSRSLPPLSGGPPAMASPPRRDEDERGRELALPDRERTLPPPADPGRMLPIAPAPPLPLRPPPLPLRPPPLPLRAPPLPLRAPPLPLRAPPLPLRWSLRGGKEAAAR